MPSIAPIPQFKPTAFSGIQGAFMNVLDTFDGFSQQALNVAENIFAIREIASENVTSQPVADAANVTPVTSGNTTNETLTMILAGVGVVGAFILLRGK